MLDEIVEKTKERVEQAKKIIPLEELKRQVSQLEISEDFPFKKALSGDDIVIIAEVKTYLIKNFKIEDFDYLKIAKEYEEAGASAISVLTEPYFFMGDDDYLREIAEAVDIPVLRKDFVIDEYMIWEAKLLGASAVLLIVSILDIVQLKRYLDLAHDLGLSAIVETHDGDEIMRAMTVGAEIIGVNNRNLNDFTVDIEAVAFRRRIITKNKLCCFGVTMIDIQNIFYTMIRFGVEIRLFSVDKLQVKRRFSAVNADLEHIIFFSVDFSASDQLASVA